MSGQLFRVQDRTGRGPWRPGFSHLWSDPEGPSHLPPAYTDFLNFPDLVRAAHSKGWHIGCCVRGFENLSRWFTAKERDALLALGFGVVNATQGKVLAESDSQVVVACRKPLKHLPPVVWSDVRSRGAA